MAEIEDQPEGNLDPLPAVPHVTSQLVMVLQWASCLEGCAATTTQL